MRVSVLCSSTVLITYVGRDCSDCCAVSDAAGCDYQVWCVIMYLHHRGSCSGYEIPEYLLNPQNQCHSPAHRRGHQVDGRHVTPSFGVWLAACILLLCASYVTSITFRE